MHWSSAAYSWTYRSYRRALPVCTNGGTVIKGCLTIQKGSYVYITGNTLHLGKMTIGPLGQGDGLVDKAGRTDYVVAENNTMDGQTIVWAFWE